MNGEIQPCPFCKSTFVSIVRNAISGFSKVRCASCEASGPLCGDNVKAVKTWNKPERDNP